MICLDASRITAVAVAVLDRPDAGRLVERAADDLLSIGAPGDAVHRLLVSLQNLQRSRPLSTFQMRTVPSWLAEASRSPSGENARS